MNWRRVAELLHLREAVRLMDERDATDERLEAEQAEVDELAQETVVQAQAARDMKNQARLGSYGRIRIDR
jgi:hypothetical protein